MPDNQELENAQKRLLDRLAPDVRVSRVGWSGGETQMLELGGGSPLLLVHGGLDNAFSWAPILPALARDRRVIAVDLPGHCLADPFDFAGVDLLDHARTFLREILDALELPTVEIMASSIGALYATALALAAPERVSRLVLVGAPAGSQRPGVPLQLRPLALPLVGQRLGRMLMSNPTRDGNRRRLTSDARLGRRSGCQPSGCCRSRISRPSLSHFRARSTFGPFGTSESVSS